MSRLDASQTELYNNLKDGLIVTDLLKKDPEFRKNERSIFLHKICNFTTLLALALTALCVALFLFFNMELTTYSVDREIEVDGMKEGTLVAFQNKTVLLGADSVSCLEKDEIIWTAPVSLSVPCAVEEGDYLAVYDQGGMLFYIFDETGLLSTTRVSREITDLDIAKTGVTAVSTMDDDAAYISYFDKYGTKIDVEIKTVISATGYPVDLSVSPNGQELMVIYYAIGTGVGESTLYFYDFENGREADNYLVESYTDYDKENTFLARCEFFSDGSAVAVGDNGMSFLSYDVKEGLNRKNVSYTGEPVSFFFEDRGIGLISAENGQNQLIRYTAEGEEKYRFQVPSSYDCIIFNKNFVFFFDERDISVYNNTGRLRYTGTLVSEPVSVSTCSGTAIYVNNGSKVSQLTFK